MAVFSLQHGSYLISTDRTLLDHHAIFAAVSQMYWAQDRTRDMMERALANSMCFGVYLNSEQVGLARVVTDGAVFAYLCDVYILEAHRGHGLGKALIQAVTGHPDLAGLRRMVLATRDAHGLYAQYGFTPLTAPERWMERFRGVDG